MKNRNRVISPAHILLPPFAPNDSAWESFAVIACDQFTSQPDYWEKASDISKDKLSAYDLILPEAYLNTPLEAEQKARVEKNMSEIEDKLALHENCFIYIERILPDGRVRPGIVGKLDLEAYDFSPDSQSLVRATEETVISRIPPRVAVRAKANVELPHVMVFADDREKLLFAPLAAKKDEMELVYSFELMLGGGSVNGYKIEGELLSCVTAAVERYENASSEGLIYAMGDGNHSLASAKAHFENIKKKNPDAAMNHPARYALVEVVDLNEPSIEFEPIYRLMKNCSEADLLAFINSKRNEAADGAAVTVVTKNGKKEITLPALHALTVGSLQIVLDEYLKVHPEAECDYIHGEDTLKELAAGEGSVGFLCPGIEKGELFDYVVNNGTLPRKTFSMGEAASKRYYIEARKITK